MEWFIFLCVRYSDSLAIGVEHRIQWAATPTDTDNLFCFW